MSVTSPEESQPKSNHNLAILGAVAVIIAIVTTSISILVYHNSGDIYLDRSRPGFLPDEKEVEQETKEDYKFSENDTLDAKNLEAYLKNYKEALDNLDKVENPYTSDALSDKALGIPENKS